MARPTRLTIAKRDILALFEQSPQKVYSEANIANILTEHREFWRLAKRTSTGEFISFLEKQGLLQKILLQADNYRRRTWRYSWGQASPFELALSISARGYLTHSTAVALHGLTNLLPKTIYLNVEQSPKPASSGTLSQASIDQAFKRKQRQSQMIYTHDDWSIIVVNGKNTRNLGVEDTIGPSQERLRVTNLERTLIDIVVRPNYSGGVFQILEAYRGAKDRLSTNRLVATLKKLQYTYPYHQAIGFLMERAGYDPKRLSLLRQIETRFDFYLAHGIEQPEYSNTWKLFYPSGL